MSELTARRRYTNGAAESSLSVTIDAAVTSFTLSTTTGFPPVPFTATLDYQGPTEEVVLVTGLSGLTVTNCVRGFDGSAAQSHSLGSTFVHTLIAADADEANDHTSSTAGHGTTGDVVGATDAQTLTNKTVSTSKLLATTTDPAAKLQVAPSGSAPALQVLASDGVTELARINRVGALTLAPTDPAVVDLLVKMASAQTANAVEVQNNAALKLLVVDAKGRIIHKPSDLSAPAVKHVPTSAAAATFLALRDTADAADQFLLTNAGEITKAAKVWLAGIASDDALRFPLDGSKFKVATDGSITTAGVVKASNMGGRFARTNTQDGTAFASTGSTENLGTQVAIGTLTAGRRYQMTLNAVLGGSASPLAVRANLRISTNTVTTASGVVVSPIGFVGAAGGTGEFNVEMTDDFVAASSVAHFLNLGITVRPGGGAGNATARSWYVIIEEVGN